MHRNRTKRHTAAALTAIALAAAFLPGSADGAALAPNDRAALAAAGGAGAAAPDGAARSAPDGAARSAPDGAGPAAPDGAGSAAPDVADPARAGRAGPVLQTVPLEMIGGRSAEAAASAVLPEQATKPFSLLGVTWADPTRAVNAVVQVRARAAATGRWGDWQTLESDGSAPGDARGATDPVWVGESNGVQAGVTGGGALPAGLRVDLINPDGPPATPASRLGRTSATPAAPAQRRRLGRQARAAIALPTRPVPRMVTRAGWGANESMVKKAPEYTGPTQVFFVHHTATGNSYRCSQSAAIVRGIQAYQVRSKGWDDIGYNFLVDKCGRIFEGRAGGVGRPVLGAHTLGFNTDASAIAVIGNYGSVPVNAAVRTAIATVAAYKLGAYGNAPAGRVVVTSGGSNKYPQGRKVNLFRISGHRDAGLTECPGNALYAQLPAIRAIAGAAPAGLRFQHMTGAVKVGRLLYTKGAIKPLWNLATSSALIDRFEIWLDGRLVLAEPGTHRTALLHLPAGGHTLTIRALHLSGRTSTITAKVVSDATAPVFTTGPDVALRSGALKGTVPIRLDWAARDVNGLSAVRLVKPTTVELGTTAYSRNGTLPPGVPATFTVQATDRAGNATSASVTRTPGIVPEAASQRTGTWRTLRNAQYLGGVALGSTATGSSATWTFTGSSAALVVGRNAASGQVRIIVDGVDEGLIDLRSPVTSYRQAVWARSWGASGSHSVRVEVAGSGAVLDGLAYLK